MEKIMLNSAQAFQSEQNSGSISIQLASPDTIRSWSFGEVVKPETINYRSFKPERDGLFCERIFGPAKNWECSCGKYKRIRYRGVICDRCGVEVTHSKVRRDRMGHIELAIPVVHIWFFKSSPSVIGTLLGLSGANMERVIYYESYIVLDPGDTEMEKWSLISQEEYDDLEDEGRNFEAKMGAPAIKQLLAALNMNTFSVELRDRLKIERSIAKKADLLKRLRIVEAFKKSTNRPEWMVLDVLPILPPDLRPLVPLEGGRFATSDLNDLYRRVINRNNRLKKLIDIKAPEVILRNEKRMLQESVDVLFDNGRRGASGARGDGRRPLKSLAELLKGKSGRFRQNLLGKRVDYSGRSVIVVGPELRMYECGLPKGMALELYKPFIIQKLEEEGYVHTVKSAKKFVEKERPEVWDILEKIIEDHPVMLNRAPTLHRLGIQAFYPKLIEGKAIRLHPLVCAAFNADFDGDQMAVHLPLSFETQLECRVLMIASNNILHPASGQPIAVPSQDIVLGLYYLTKARVNLKPDGFQFATKEEYDNHLKRFFNEAEAIRAYESDVDNAYLAYNNVVNGEYRNWEDVADATEEQGYNPGLAYTSSNIALNKAILVKLNVGRKIYASVAFQDVMVRNEEEQEVLVKMGEKIEHSWLLEDTYVETTVGRCFLAQLTPEELGFINVVMNKKTISRTVDDLYRRTGNWKTVQYLDALKDQGFKWSSKAGISPGMCDMIIPPTKFEMIDETQDRVDQIMDLYETGVITDGERYNQVIDAWSHTTNEIATLLFSQLSGDRDGFNPVFMMADSGARGSREQIKQLSGMRGLMQKPTKKLGGQEVIENPIKSSFREGLNVMEYFVSTHGSRKGLADTALKTADAGYLTRRLVDVAQDVVITEPDCGTKEGIEVRTVKDGDDIVEEMTERILGRITTEDILHPVTGEVLIVAGELIDEKTVDKVEGAGLESMVVRSVLTCESYRGICAACYGRNLASGRQADMGEAVGVIAAQSIGEPGTQLTLRTFHIGGASSRLTVESSKKAPVDCKVTYENLDYLTRENGDHIVLSRSAECVCLDSHSIVRGRFNVPYGSILKVLPDQLVKGETELYEWDPYNSAVVITASGTVAFDEIVKDKTLIVEYDSGTGLERYRIVSDRNAKLRPHINIIDENGTRLGRYALPEGGYLQVKDGDVVDKGTTLTKLARAVGKTKDITGGLPRVAELFEARSPKRSAVIAANDGVLYYAGVERGQQRVFVISQDDTSRFNVDADAEAFGIVPENLKVTKTGIVWALNTLSNEVEAAPEPTEGETPVKKTRRKLVVREPRAGIDFVFFDSSSELIPRGRHMAVHDGDRVKSGEKLCEGSENPHDILRVSGVAAVQEYLVNGIQGVYRLQGVAISDKHIECIVRQMLRKVIVDSPGGSALLEGEEISRARLRLINDDLRKQGKEEVTIIAKLLGITRSSLATDSFISAASFQETTKVLTRASIEGMKDDLVGLKENVIMGRLIPSGTGALHLRATKVRDLDVVDEPKTQQFPQEVVEYDED
jgi:DNA-directed RNA polymerase subunit beta'